MTRKAVVSYLRASRGRTHRSNLEVEIQRDLCAAFAREHGYRIVAEYVEIEFSKGADNLDLRPRLRAALARARRERCPMVVSHLDRLARNVNFLSSLVDEDVALLVAGGDTSGSFAIGSLNRVAARLPSPARSTVGAGPSRTPVGPHDAAALGRRVIAEQADRFARTLLPVIRAVQNEGASTLSAIAQRRPHVTPKLTESWETHACREPNSITWLLV
jgi:hypothetical protein